MKYLILMLALAACDSKPAQDSKTTDVLQPDKIERAYAACKTTCSNGVEKTDVSTGTANCYCFEMSGKKKANSQVGDAYHLDAYSNQWVRTGN